MATCSRDNRSSDDRRFLSLVPRVHRRFLGNYLRRQGRRPRRGETDRRHGTAESPGCEISNVARETNGRRRIPGIPQAFDDAHRFQGPMNDRLPLGRRWMLASAAKRVKNRVNTVAGTRLCARWLAARKRGIFNAAFELERKKMEEISTEIFVQLFAID